MPVVLERKFATVPVQPVCKGCLNRRCHRVHLPLTSRPIAIEVFVSIRGRTDPAPGRDSDVPVRLIRASAENCANALDLTVGTSRVVAKEPRVRTWAMPLGRSGRGRGEAAGGVGPTAGIRRRCRLGGRRRRVGRCRRRASSRCRRRRRRCRRGWSFRGGSKNPSSARRSGTRNMEGQLGSGSGHLICGAGRSLPHPASRLAG